jgi:hypothetical protein
MRHLIGMLNPLSDDDPLVIEVKDRLSYKVIKTARHPPLAAIMALATCFGMKEMEPIVESEFADVFVPLLLAMGSYAGIMVIQPLKANGTAASSYGRRQSDSNKSAILNPYTMAGSCLQAFLSCKGCNSVALVVAKAKSLCEHHYEATMSREFSDFVAFLTESLCVDFPLYLPRLSAAFKLKTNQGCHLVTAASFYAQLLLTETAVVEVGLQDTAIEMLLALHKHQDHLPLVRIIYVDGLSGYKLDTIEKYKTLKRHSANILAAVMDIIGDEFDSDVNFHTLNALSKLIPALPPKDVAFNLSGIVTKVSPFFDGGKRRRDGAAAMKAFAQLAAFVRDLKSGDDLTEADVLEATELFGELTHQVMVSLLLHANDDGVDERGETRDASRETLARIFDGLQNKHMRQVKVHHLEAAGRRFNYSDFLKDFCHTDLESYLDMFPAYVERSMSYFRIGDSRLRANAVILVTCLLVEGCRGTSNHGHINAEQICNAMAKLLTDGNSEVQIAAAANIGKVCICLGGKRQPRLSLSKSDSEY